MTEQMPSAPPKFRARDTFRWWESMPEPLVYYCVDLFERMVMEGDERASGRLETLLEWNRWKVSCRHGGRVGAYDEDALEVLEEHQRMFRCHCLTFVYNRLLTYAESAHAAGIRELRVP